MKHFFIFLTTLFLTISCKHSAEHHELTADATKEADPVISRTLVAPQKFEELPPLANYINELDLLYEDVNNSVKLENSVIVLAEPDYNYDGIDTFALNFASFFYNFYEEGDGFNTTTTYSLLSDGSEPIVLITTQYDEKNGSSLDDLRKEDSDDAEFEAELLAEGVEESKIATILERTASRKLMNPSFNLGSCYDENLSQIELSVWQKKAGQWQNINKKVFAPNMVQELIDHFPFLSLDKESTTSYHNNEKNLDGIYLKTNLIPKSALMANKINWLTWFGVSDLKDLNLQLTIHGDDIWMELSKHKAIKWEWDGTKYTLKDLPSKVEWINNPCPNISFTTANTYQFKGKIGDAYNIEMQVKITPQKGKLLLQGNYWYVNQVDSKFPISGELSNDAGSFTFYRKKSGENRESFDCYFDGCKMTGWWQHFGNMDILPFYLELQ